MSTSGIYIWGWAEWAFPRLILKGERIVVSNSLIGVHVNGDLTIALVHISILNEFNLISRPPKKLRILFYNA